MTESNPGQVSGSEISIDARHRGREESLNMEEESEWESYTWRASEPDHIRERKWGTGEEKWAAIFPPALNMHVSAAESRLPRVTAFTTRKSGMMDLRLSISSASP